MKKLIILGSLTALIFSACRRDDTSYNPGNALNSTDQNFMTMVSMSNHAEIQQGMLAATKGNNAGVKTFGQFMVNEHTQAQNDLQAVATNYNMRLTDSIASNDAMTYQTINGLSGRSFDSAYLQSQIAAHQATLNLFNTELNSGQNTMLRNYAAKYQPHIQMHLNMADSVYRTL